MLYKNAIINLVSIFEALVFECVHNICSPSACQFIKHCNKHFSKGQRNNSIEAVKRLNSLDITDFNDDEIKRISEIIDLRNKVHIRLSPENEFMSSGFTLSTYNEIIALLQRTSECLFEKGIRVCEEKSVNTDLL